MSNIYSENRYKTLFENAKDSIFIMDPHFFLDCNPNTLKMFDCQKEDLIGKTPMDFSPEYQPDGLKSIEKGNLLINAALNGEIIPFEWLHTTKNGKEFFTEVSLTRVELDDKIFLQAIVRDISYRKIISVLVQQERDFTEMLINTLPGIFYLFDISSGMENAKLVRFNKNRYFELLGYDSIDLHGVHPMFFFKKEDYPKLEQVLTNLFEFKKYDMEMEILHKNGNSFPYLFHAVVFTLQNKSYFMGFGIDVLEQKKAEIKLKEKNEELFKAKTKAEESEAKYSVLVNNTAFPIVVSSFEGKILFANEIANSFFDVKNTQEINITDFWNKPEQRDFFVSEIKEFGKVENFEAEVKRKNGDVYTLIVNSTLVVYNGDLAIYNVYNDITQRKQAENLVKEKNEEYEALNEELQQSNKDLSHAKENIERFTEKLIESEKALKLKLDYILSPDNKIENLSLTDIIELEQLQKIQDAFVKATGVASIITDVEGKPITQASNFSGVCNLIRQTEKGRANCFNSDKLIGLRAAKENKPCYERCHSCGFIDAGAPIIIAGKQLAIWMIGQSNVGEVDEKRIKHYANEIGANEKEMLQEYSKMKNMSIEQFENVTNLLSIFAQEISTLAFNNIQLAKKIEERKQFEIEKLRLSKIVEDSLNEIYIIDIPSLKFKYANQAALNNLGYDFSDILNITPADISPNLSIENLRKLGEPFFNNNKTLLVFDAVHKRKNGTFYPVEINLQLFVENNEKMLFAFVNDISKRKTAEETLLKSVEHNKALIATSPDLIFVQDENGVFLEYYAPDENLLYLKPEFFIGKNMSEIFPDYLVDKLNFYIQKAINTNEIQVYEYELPLQPNKEIRIFEARIKKFAKDKIMSIIRDITERKQNEIAIKESEEKYRFISENTADVIWTMDLKSQKFTFVSPSIEKLRGFTAEEVMTQTMSDALTYESFKSVNELLSKEVFGKNFTDKSPKTVTSIINQIRKDGSIVPTEASTTIIFDKNGNPSSIIGVSRDISERIKNEQALIQSEYKFRNIFNSSSDGILILDTNYIILNVNETLLNLLHFTLDDGIGKHIFEFVNPQYIPLLIERAKKLIDYKNVETTEIEIIDKNKQKIPVELNSRIITYDNQPVVLAIVRNISERKSFERQILRNVIETEEKERMHFSQELHDGIGPLLSATKMYIQWLGMPNANLDKSEILKDTEKLIDESARTVREISFKLSPHVLQNYGLVDATKSYAEKIKETSEIEIEIIGEKIERFDENAETIAYRVICECLNNTLKHAQASKITINIGSKNDVLEVKYSDNGKGFDVNETVSKHTGIGLLNMQSRIKSLNGFLEIKSTAENGTTINFNLKMHKI